MAFLWVAIECYCYERQQIEKDLGAKEAAVFFFRLSPPKTEWWDAYQTDLDNWKDKLGVSSNTSMNLHCLFPTQYSLKYIAACYTLF